MIENQQPEALRLIDELDRVAKWSDSEHWDTLNDVAAELRRLHKVETKSKKYRKRLVKISFEKKELLNALKQCRESLHSAEAFNQLAMVDEIISRMEDKDVAIP